MTHTKAVMWVHCSVVLLKPFSAGEDGGEGGWLAVIQL